FVFVGERLWLDFVNCEHGVRRFDALREFESMVRWLEAASVLDAERANGIRRRAQQQPSAASAAVVDGRRVRAAARLLAEPALVRYGDMRQPCESRAPSREAQGALTHYVDAVRTYLELSTPGQLRAVAFTDPAVQVVRRDHVVVAHFRQLYRAVGRQWQWRDR